MESRIAVPYVVSSSLDCIHSDCEIRPLILNITYPFCLFLAMRFDNLVK